MRLARLILLPLTVIALSPAVTHAQQTPPPRSFLLTVPCAPAALSDWQLTTGRGTVYDPIDGATLRGYVYIGAKPNAPSILFFNSQQATLEGNDALYRSLAALGPTVFVYDYRGCGFSTGTSDLLHLRSDALALYDNVARSMRPNQPVIVYGFSIGTAIAAYVASQRPVAALVLAAPITSAADELSSYTKLLGSPYDKYTLTPTDTLVLDELSLVAHSKAPLLVIHSKSDTVVPITQGRRVFAASPSTAKLFIELPTSTHGETPSRPQSLRAIKALLKTLPISPTTP